MDLAGHFIKTFDTNTWGSSESISGPGSEKESSLVKDCIIFVVKFINKFLQDKETIIISDIPCGDLNWINMLFIEILSKTKCKKIEYYAYDIVDKIEDIFNNMNKIDNVNYHFKVFNAVTDVPVKADFILCKEMFIHLSYLHINNCLTNFKNSGSTYLFCTDSSDIENEDIKYESLGQCRDVSLMLSPFNLPEPIFQFSCYKAWELNNM